MARPHPPRLHRRPAVRVLLLALLAGTAACGSSGGGPPPAFVVGALAADFTLEDVNAASATHTMDVSVRDYVTTVSVWYFGKAT